MEPAIDREINIASPLSEDKEKKGGFLKDLFRKKDGVEKKKK